MNNAVIYARFSSDKQTENSIEAQVRACEDYAEIHGYTINKIYSDEAVSAKNDRRPEFQKMIKDAEKGLFQTVLVHKYNRFFAVSDVLRYRYQVHSRLIQLLLISNLVNHSPGEAGILVD